MTIFIFLIILFIYLLGVSYCHILLYINVHKLYPYLTKRDKLIVFLTLISSWFGVYYLKHHL